MSNTNEQVVYTIIAVITILLFLGILLIVVLLYYHKKQKNIEVAGKQQRLQSQLEMQEQTFNIISQEIHDNVGQALSLAKVQLNLLEQGNTFNKNLVAETKESISKAISDLRDIAKSLNTDRIEQSLLPEIISDELARISRSGLMHTDLQVEGEVQTIQSQKKLIIFRIIQEALQNIIKHSKASSICLHFHYYEDCLKIIIADNGNGFDTNIMTKKDGLGLQNIVSRAALIGGKADIQSTINEGTTITIETPYT